MKHWFSHLLHPTILFIFGSNGLKRNHRELPFKQYQHDLLILKNEKDINKNSFATSTHQAVKLVVSIIILLIPKFLTSLLCVNVFFMQVAFTWYQRHIKRLIIKWDLLYQKLLVVFIAYLFLGERRWPDPDLTIKIPNKLCQAVPQHISTKIEKYHELHPLFCFYSWCHRSLSEKVRPLSLVCMGIVGHFQLKPPLEQSI